MYTYDELENSKAPKTKQQNVIREITHAFNNMRPKKHTYVMIYLTYKRADQKHMKTTEGKRRFRKIRTSAVKRLKKKGSDNPNAETVAMEIWRMAHHYIQFNPLQRKRDEIILTLEKG